MIYLLWPRRVRKFTAGTIETMVLITLLEIKVATSAIHIKPVSWITHCSTRRILSRALRGKSVQITKIAVIASAHPTWACVHFVLYNISVGNFRNAGRISSGVIITVSSSATLLSIVAWRIKFSKGRLIPAPRISSRICIPTFWACAVCRYALEL